MDGIKASISAETKETAISSSKVVESLDVKTTKSILLRRVIEQCASVNKFDNSVEGDWVKVDHEVRAMEKKGIKTGIGELNRAIRQFNQMFISLKESIQWMKTAYEEMKAELDRRQNPTLLESLKDYYDKKTQGRPPLPNFYAEMKRRGKNLSNLQEFAKSMAAVRSLIFIGKVRKDPTTRVLIHEKSSLAPPGETMAFKLGDEEGFRWVGAYEISADELLDGKEGKATETKLERGAKLIRELLADKKEISIRELDEKAKEQGISGRTMRDVRSRMKNELEYQVNEKQENSIQLKE